MEGNKQKLVSDFNEAGFQIQRLHLIWTSCNYLASHGRLTDWNWKLDRAFVELTKDMDDEDGEEESRKKDSYYQKILEIDKEILQNQKSRTKLYRCLIRKEQMLRRLQEACGKGSKKKSEGEDLMD